MVEFGLRAEAGCTGHIEQTISIVYLGDIVLAEGQLLLESLDFAFSSCLLRQQLLIVVAFILKSAESQYTMIYRQYIPNKPQVYMFLILSIQ